MKIHHHAVAVNVAGAAINLFLAASAATFSFWLNISVAMLCLVTSAIILYYHKQEWDLEEIAKEYLAARGYTRVIRARKRVRRTKRGS
jgi:uncharacterized membrane protein